MIKCKPQVDILKISLLGQRKVRGTFNIFKYFQTVNFSARNFPDKCIPTVIFLIGPQNSKSLKHWANDEPGFMSGLFYSTKVLLKT